MRAPVNRHVRSGDVLASFAMGAAGIARGARAELVFHGMAKTADSLILAVEIGARGRAIEAGRLYTYGEGEPSGRHEARFDPVTLVLDVTEALGQLPTASPATLTLRIMDHKGTELADRAIFIEEVELRPAAAD
jgi:hypothetical protein